MAATPDIIEVDVGGVHYKTIRSTLTKYPDSLLAAIFKFGSHVPRAVVTHNGSYFIDRNGPLFHYVLSFLRNPSGILYCPTNWGVNEYRELLAEATYYQIQPMVHRITDNIRRLEDDIQKEDREDREWHCTIS